MKDRQQYRQAAGGVAKALECGMTVFFLESVSELILFGLLPLFVTVATVWILWRVLEKTDADEVIDIRSFLTFIVVRSALSKNGDGIRQSTELADLRRHGKGEGNGRLEKTDQSNR